MVFCSEFMICSEEREITGVSRKRTRRRISVGIIQTRLRLRCGVSMAPIG
jgi:hypothetical protein